MNNSRHTQGASSPRDLLTGYRQQAGNRDEMLDGAGNVKPVWQEFLDHLQRLGDTDLTHRFARGDQYLRDAGVLYRQYDDTVSVDRGWPLSHLPVMLSEAEWREISAGLIQRADLLEHVVRDLYGPGELVASGQLPASLLTQNPAWLRPMVGVTPANGNFLNLLSFEIGRGPNGKWWVISDLVEAPSTAGFVIENRVAMTKVFPNFFNGSNVHRIAGFFQDFQQQLFNLRGNSKGQIALLSSGPANQNYAEHAYIARYLGMLLVEGEDLIVQDGHVMVRTVAGPKPLSLLWNRVPSALCDPLELDQTSLIGTPGLVDALRQQQLHLVNAIGAAVLETRALMAFLPKIARQHFGAPLKLPNIATWWCGQETARAHVIKHRDTMMVGSAFSTVPLMADSADQGAPAAPTQQEIAALLQRSGRELVGQESITLSTTPTYEDGALVARPMCIRLFLARTPDGWQVMPGGYAQVSAGNDAKAFAMQRGGKVADVWIRGEQPVETPSLLESGAAENRAATSRAALPSRAADNLFWLGRYVERAEQNIRLFRAYFARINDGASHDAPLLAFMRSHLMQDVAAQPAAMAERFGAPLDMALNAARKIGDRFAPDGLMALRALVATTSDLDQRDIPLEEFPRETSQLLRQITGFAGLVHENMYRSDGWRFLSLGISLERAANMAQLLSQLVGPDAPDGALDLALEVGDSVVSYHARFSILTNKVAIADILGVDDQNPRSIRYHVSRAKRHIAELPGQSDSHVLSDVARQILLLETTLAASAPSALTPEMLGKVKTDIWDIADALTLAHLV
ncbi:circularly permuted type 2 ATP-grasp protein [Roseobacter sp. GAI101]|uniref:circularly permuted type 2 ATP-grasp protein n=1 Tax=Roseobacter sp. (strain GAI101) TaxID=391589 RepID=UPI0001871625|nr:circularly permuted type 2 ATP-grasp protein [Roseobacter sp. GAI101]EEB84411.1 conserved domain protein [Roseobacter sp. GAI101]